MNKALNSELIAPSWLDDSFLETALKSGENDDSIKVISSDIKPATLPGDNYGSDMFRAVVKIARGTQNEEKSLIIKTVRLGLTGEMGKMINTKFFQVEIDTFAVAHPALYGVLNKFSIGNSQPFAAKHIYSHKEYSKRAIILEDLKKQGFRLAERKLGLDLNHCLLVMRTIARYHAASVVAFQKHPEIKDLFLQKPSSDEDVKAVESFLSRNVMTCANEVATWPDYKERYVHKLNKLKDTAMEEWIRANKLDENSFNVLNHGDLWANNMMFRYGATGELEEVRFVDFQVSRWTTPAIDLQYFLNSSASPELLENISILVEEYHSTLCKILTLLGYKQLQPSLKQLNEDFEERGLFGVLSAITIRAFALVDRSKVPDFNKMLAKEEDLNLTETYKTSMKKLLPLYERRGWL